MSNNIGGLLTQGGVSATGPQTALNQYTMGEGEVANAYNFGRGNFGMSTNETQGASGPEAGFATSQGLSSLANTAAQAANVQSGFQNFAGGLGSLLGGIGGKGG